MQIIRRSLVSAAIALFAVRSRNRAESAGKTGSSPPPNLLG